MIAQSVAFLVCEQPHAAVKVVAPREVEYGVAVLLLRIHFDVDAPCQSVLLVAHLAHTHVHLLGLVD